MSLLKSCGFLIVRGDPVREFLLMRHDYRWDLPKGHVDGAETEIECALRELAEETGIAKGDIEIVPEFRYEAHYPVRSRQDGQVVDKTLVIFLGRLKRDVSIALSEHPGFQWFRWQPPHHIQTRTIDPLLAHLEAFCSQS
jgi:bis(5'-nucleosidyl)-tetraphosphatase